MESAGRAKQAVGGLAFLAGALVTALSVAASWHGGTYVVATGALLYGMLEYLRGRALLREAKVLRARNKGDAGQAAAPPPVDKQG